MKVEDLPAGFDHLPRPVREFLAVHAENGFTDTVAAINLIWPEGDPVWNHPGEG